MDRIKAGWDDRFKREFPELLVNGVRCENLVKSFILSEITEMKFPEEREMTNEGFPEYTQNHESKGANEMLAEIKQLNK